jgi:tRNA A37 threonylcarbamoyladenosine synthetase subunit TsaC/SUA5/YrdC
MLRDARDPAAVQAAVGLLQAGELVAFPTETVYGLGADAGNDAAVGRIFAAKGRPSDHPLIVHVPTRRPSRASHPGCPRWPGGWSTRSGPAPDVDPAAAPEVARQPPRAARTRSACAAPATRWRRRLLQQCAAAVPPVLGLAAPSANQFGRVSPTTARTCRPSSATGCWCSMAAPATSASNPPSSTAPAAGRCCCGPACSRPRSSRPPAASRCCGPRTCPTPRRAPPARWRRTTRRGPGCG